MTMRFPAMKWPRAIWVAPIVTGALLLAACSTKDLLTVETPDIITPDKINNAAGAEALRARAIGDFATLLNGNLGLANIGGLFADELVNARPGLDHIDQRKYDETQNYNFSQWTAAKNRGERAIASLKKYLAAGADQNTKVGHMYTLVGMSHILVAEHFCNGIPFGRVSETGDLEFEQTPASVEEVFRRAVAQFDSALQVLPATATNYRYFARVGKARALMNMAKAATKAADMAAAAKVVQAGGDPANASVAVPTTFVWNAEYSQISIGNGLYDWIQASGNFSVANNEGNGNGIGSGGQGLDYIASRDPRLLVDAAPFRLGQDGSTPIVKTALTQTRDTPMKAATGVEARLIEAEADLAGGGSNWLTILNTLRATVSGLTPLADPGSADARVDMLFRERAFWMVLTAHRTGDLRRLIRQYGRAASNVFPSGRYFKGGDYGNDVNMPVPTSERNRPENAPYTGCTDRNA
jgi:starch-binding outer membrane protein, SusD/RagB family